MAIKNFITKDSYSKIERVDTMKATETVDFYLSTYKDNTCKESILKDVRYSCINNAMSKQCTCNVDRATCKICEGTGYIAKNEYDDVFKEALKQDVNVLSICYRYLMTKPEFIGTEEV